MDCAQLIRGLPRLPQFGTEFKIPPVCHVRYIVPNEGRPMRDIRTAREGEVGWGWVVGYSAFTVLLRLAPYLLGIDPQDDLRWLWNLTAVGALGLFAGARLRSPAAYFVALGTMLVSDLLLV